MANLRGDYTALLSNRVYGKFVKLVEERRNHYAKELLTNPAVGDMAAKGTYWQNLVKVLDSILDAPARIVNGEDKD